MTAPDYATRHRWQNRVRWRIAHELNRLPWTCWTNLVSWALHDRPPWIRGEGTSVRQDSLCQTDADACGECYCGKLRSAKQDTAI